MFRDYILGAEIAFYANINISNISMAISGKNMVEGNDYFKFGGITLLKKDSNNLSKSIKNYIFENKDKFTDLNNLYPHQYLKEAYSETITKIYKEVKIMDKKFLSLKDEYKYLESILRDKNIIKVLLPLNEAIEFYENKEIIGYEKLTQNEAIGWWR